MKCDFWRERWLTEKGSNIRDRVVGKIFQNGTHGATQCYPRFQSIGRHTNILQQNFFTLWSCLVSRQFVKKWLFLVLPFVGAIAQHLFAPFLSLSPFRVSWFIAILIELNYLNNCQVSWWVGINLYAKWRWEIINKLLLMTYTLTPKRRILRKILRFSIRSLKFFLGSSFCSIVQIRGHTQFQFLPFDFFPYAFLLYFLALRENVG